jgi:hypothetical protein
MIEALTPLAALVAGFAGSAHCVLMCGSIAGALGLGGQAGSACAEGRPRYTLLHNLGRVTSYTAAGAAAGAVGGGTLALAGLPRLHTAFAVLAAVVVVLAGIRFAAGSRRFGWMDRAAAQAWRHIAPLTRGLFPITTPARAFGAGLAWGWLPCGMAYAMLAAAALSGSGASGATLMAMFGLGTLPAMLALGGGTARMLGPRLRRAGGILLVLLGVASGAMALWRAAPGHEAPGAHSHVAAGSALGADLPGQRGEPRRVDDADRLALDFDDPELGEAREQPADGLDDQAEIVRKVAARHRQVEQQRVAAHAREPLG